MKATSCLAVLGAALLTFPAFADEPARATAQDRRDETPKGLSIELPLEDIAAHPEGLSVLTDHLSDLMNGPMYDVVKSMTLREIQPLSQGRMPAEKL